MTQNDSLQSAPSPPSVDECVEIITCFQDKVDKLTSEVDGIWIVNPLALARLFPLDRGRRELREGYQEAIRYAEAIKSAPWEAIGIMAGGVIASRFTESLSRKIDLQCGWNNLSALFDRKYAFNLTAISLYIALISLAVAVASIL